MEKTALVTGSTNNIGKAIAEVLAEKGFHVLVTSRHEEEARAVSEELPGKGSYLKVDFSQVASIEGLFAFIRDRFRQARCPCQQCRLYKERVYRGLRLRYLGVHDKYKSQKLLPLHEIGR